jgi:hypothetical protein
MRLITATILMILYIFAFVLIKFATVHLDIRINWKEYCMLKIEVHIEFHTLILIYRC